MGSSLTSNLFVFILAAFLGYEVVRRVSPQLHTPLMSLTNAISAISVVGAITIAGLQKCQILMPEFRIGTRSANLQHHIRSRKQAATVGHDHGLPLLIDRVGKTGGYPRPSLDANFKTGLDQSTEARRCERHATFTDKGFLGNCYDHRRHTHAKNGYYRCILG